LDKEFKIRIEPLHVEFKTGKERNLLDAFLTHGIEIESICGGNGICGKCIIRVERGQTSLPTEIERKILGKRLEKKYRLACQTYPLSDLVITIPLSSMRKRGKILEWGIMSEVDINPEVKCRYVELQRPTLEDQRPDEDRILDGLSLKTIDYQFLTQLSKRIRSMSWKGFFIYRDEELLGVEEEKRIYGVAVDIGTTTIVAYLVDLITGNIVKVKSDYNPQISFGEDVISRIEFSLKENGLLKLHETLIDGINQLIQKLCKEEGITPDRIYQINCAGNTVMLSTLLRTPIEFIGKTPFIPPFTKSKEVKSRELKVSINRAGYVYTLPSVSGYIGGDVIGDILTANVINEREYFFLIDIGTNGELVLGNSERILSVSCAAGPALEGMGIKYGMRGTVGAIERVYVDPYSWKPYYRVIGGVKARGICGSGLIDAVAGMYVAGIINGGGRLIEKGYNIKEVEGERMYVIAHKEETDMGEEIGIIQRDVRNVQLAKAAFYAGYKILIESMGVKPEDIKKIYIAGAFGNYISASSAVLIGLLPDLPNAKVISIGNGAGMGACRTLISIKEKELAEEIADKIEYIELSSEKKFYKEFVKATQFPHENLEEFPRVKKVLETKNISILEKY